VLRRICAPKRDKMIGGWRKVRNQELHNLYSSENKIRMIESRKMKLTGNVARMGRRGMHTGFWWKARRKETTRKTQI
jgi:hypothetical protein